MQGFIKDVFLYIIMDVHELVIVAKEAGKVIMDIYSRDFSVEVKKDNSPLTEADEASNRLIVDRLSKFKIPIISEESKQIPYSERKEFEEYFLVDPLDGTKEFIKKNGEFTVNIAYCTGNTVKMGVVHVPATGVTYYGSAAGSFRDGIKLPLSLKHDKLIVVASRSHFSLETKKFVEELGSDYELKYAGSALKMCLIASGEADIYPRLGGTMEWDTAAAHAVVKFAGKKVLKYGTEDELEYNKEDLTNPWFVVQ